MRKSKALSKATERLPWAVWPEKEGSSLLLGPRALPGPQQHLAQLEAPAYRDSPVLHVELALEFKALDLETGVLGEQGQLVCCREFCGALPVAGVQGRLSCSPQFHRNAEFGGFLVSQRVAVVMITILQGWRTPPSMSSGTGLAPGELGDAADVRLCQPLCSCAQQLPANEIFNRPELSFSTLFSFVSTEKLFPSILGITECHSFNASFVLLHWK